MEERSYGALYVQSKRHNTGTLLSTKTTAGTEYRG